MRTGIYAIVGLVGIGAIIAPGATAGPGDCIRAGLTTMSLFSDLEVVSMYEGGFRVIVPVAPADPRTMTFRALSATFSCEEGDVEGTVQAVFNCVENLAANVGAIASCVRGL